MGARTVALLGTSADVSAALGASPPSALPQAELPRTSVVLLAQLAAASDLPGVRAVDFRPMGDPTPDGPWVLRFPDVLVEALDELDDSRLDAVAQRWARAPEWAPAHPDGPALAPYLAELRSLAQRARADGPDLFLWWSP